MPPASDIVPNVRRIAVLKAGGLGDVLFALPALDALRAAYPAAHVTLLTSPIGVELFSSRPGPVDEAVAVPPFAGPSADGEGVRRVCERIAAHPPDLALQMHGGGAESNPLVASLGARVTAGLRATGAPGLGREVPYVYFQSEVMRCLEVAATVGAAPVSLEPRLARGAAELAAADRLLGHDGRPLAVLHPGAGDPRRRWPAERFGTVAGALAGAGARIAVVGTAEDRAFAAETASAVEGAADLAGATSLPALAGILARAAVVVSNDSGPLHLAAALGAPTVGVYWCGNLVNAGPATVARHRTVASWRLACPECGADCMGAGCDHDASFVADVPVPAVTAEALDLLSQSVADRAAAGARYHP